MNRLAAAVFASLSLSVLAAGDPELSLTIENNKFTPDRLEIPANKSNKSYLKTKKAKLGHLLEHLTIR